MSIDRAKAELNAAAAKFKKTVAGFKYPERSFTEIIVGGWRTAVASAGGRAVVSYRDALAGLVAAQDILYKLANASGDPAVVRKYIDDMEKLTAEAARILAEGWEASEKEYAAADAFRTAAASLKDALATAKAQAQALNLAADLISAFSRLLIVV